LSTSTIYSAPSRPGSFNAAINSASPANYGASQRMPSQVPTFQDLLMSSPPAPAVVDFAPSGLCARTSSVGMKGSTTQFSRLVLLSLMSTLKQALYAGKTTITTY
ncbi:hypothetical protein H310_15042, partial [Aphanomyces invadans]